MWMSALLPERYSSRTLREIWLNGSHRIGFQSRYLHHEGELSSYILSIYHGVPHLFADRAIDGRFPVGMELCGGIRLCEVVDS